jgi:hypothetical protein
LGSWSLAHSGEVAIEKKGVTVIVHGFVPPLFGFPDWELVMANGILDRAKVGNIFKNNPISGQWEVFGNTNTNNSNDEIILLYDWAELSRNGLTSSNYEGNGYLEAAADHLFALLNVKALPGMGQAVNLLSQDKPLHFIAHSRGNPLSLQVCHRLKKYFPNNNMSATKCIKKSIGINRNFELRNQYKISNAQFIYFKCMFAKCIVWDKNSTITRFNYLFFIGLSWGYDKKPKPL